jgi:hypothetical protein
MLGDHGRTSEITELALQQSDLESELNTIENGMQQEEILLQLDKETKKKKERKPKFGPLIVFAHDLSNHERGGWGDYVSQHDNRMIAQNQLQSVARRSHVFKAWIVDVSSGQVINTLQKPWTAEQIAAMSVNLKTITQ